MPRIVQKEALKGSQRSLQFLVNRARDVLDDALRKGLRLTNSESIEWLSPLEVDSFAEYQDDDFLRRLSISPNKRSLKSFWPRGGPVWDGLARTGRGDIVLIEAKAHASEVSSTCQAKPPSRVLIESSLRETARHYGVASPTGWTKGYYQYANRLAHLYLLRELNDLAAWLVFVYFVNDTDMGGPGSARDWQAVIDAIHRQLGVSEDRLRPYVQSVFVDVSSLRT